MLKAHRLWHQQIEYPQFTNAMEVLAYFGAMQGQDYSGAKWSLGLRLADCTNVQLEQLITDKKIVRTWLMRGTLFMTTAKDVRWLLDIVAPREISRSKRRYKELELDARTRSKSNDILVRAIADGKQVGRRQLYTILEENGISTKGQRGVHIVRYASLEGLIVQCGMYQNDPLFTRMDSIPDTIPMPKLEALARLAYLYFNSHGWAKLQDFSWWTGLLMADVREGFEAIRSDLIEVVIDGESYYHTDNAIAIASSKSSCVHILPGFDEYYLGYKKRDDVIDTQYEYKICPGKNGVFFPTIVIDGQIRGIWKRSFKNNVIEVIAVPFTTLNGFDIEALNKAIHRFAKFLDMPVDASIEN